MSHPIERRPLGRTGLDVSSICLGTMTFGEQNSEADAHSQLDMAVDASVNFIDTAEMYPVPPKAETQGRTEQYVGSWLKKRGRHDDLVIATKVTGPGFDYLPGSDKLNAKRIHAALDGNLKRLGVDCIDLYQVHWPERNTNYFGQLGYTEQPESNVTPIEQTLEALAQAVDAGKIRHIGVSNETPWGVAEFLRVAAARGWPRIASIQNPYNLLNRTFEVGLAEFSHREDVGLLAYSPMAFGALSGKYLDGARPAGARITLFERFKRYLGEVPETAIAAYVELAKEHGIDPAQMALTYVTSRPFVTSNIIGATTLDQLTDNLASAQLALDDAVISGIEAIHAQHPNPCP